MLVNFRFGNYRSFRDETWLSMEATSDKEFEEINTAKIESGVMPKNGNELLKSAIIFGANASGKSNIIKALAYMRNVVLMSPSLPFVSKNESFAFIEDSKNEDTIFEVEIIQNDTFYRYGYTIRDLKIHEEWLYRRKERLIPVFQREEDKVSIRGTDKLTAKLINIPDTTLFLSIANNLHLAIREYLIDVITWFKNLLIVFENNMNSLDMYTIDNGKYKDAALNILKEADIGIEDMNVVKDKIGHIGDVLSLNTQLQTMPRQIIQDKSDLYDIDLKTTFPIYNEQKDRISTKEVHLFKDEGFHSEGTTRLMLYLGWILAALDNKRVILIDEIDSKLHFLVADYIVKLFNSIDRNPNNAQLICTAHNVLLMDGGLRRDQIYFTSKNKYGESGLTSLSDYKSVRKNDLFSKKYLAGFYTSLPDLKND